MGTASSVLGFAGGAALEIAPVTGPAAPFVIAGGLVASFVGAVLPPPRGEFQLFKRTAYPVCLQQAQATGITCMVYWFEGDIVAVYADGNFGVIANKSTLAEMYAYLNELAKDNIFYLLECPKEYQDINKGLCSFRLYGDHNFDKGIEIPSLISPEKLKTYMPIIVIVGILLLAFAAKRFL